MQVKVIKTINGLEEGDILNYNEKTHKYELKKIEEDISDNGYSSKKTLHTYSKNVIQDNLKYFQFIDENEDNVYLNEEIKPKEDIKIKESSPYEAIEKLENKIKDLEQQLDSYINPRRRYIPGIGFLAYW